MKIYNILYIHGMGGGEDSRIPSILNEHIGEYISPESDISIDIIVRTYDIDPDIAEKQIAAWRQELNPELVIGESLGSLHAIRIGGGPHAHLRFSCNRGGTLDGIGKLPSRGSVVHAKAIPAASRQASATRLHKGHPQALSRYARKSAKSFTLKRK
mgnify:CR=1 FL=1